MPKKAPKRSSRASAAPAGPPLLKAVIGKILRLFEEDLPVSEFRGPGKFDTEVAGVRDHQDALASICGGRFEKAHRHTTRALLTPDARAGSIRVEMRGKDVGHLKPADAKYLQKQLTAANVGPCALKVPALILGGRRKKNGEEEDFTVMLCLPPKPKPPKKPVQFDGDPDE